MCQETDLCHSTPVRGLVEDFRRAPDSMCRGVDLRHSAPVRGLVEGFRRAPDSMCQGSSVRVGLTSFNPGAGPGRGFPTRTRFNVPRAELTSFNAGAGPGRGFPTRTGFNVTRSGLASFSADAGTSRRVSGARRVGRANGRGSMRAHVRWGRHCSTRVTPSEFDGRARANRLKAEAGSGDRGCLVVYCFITLERILAAERRRHALSSRRDQRAVPAWCLVSVRARRLWRQIWRHVLSSRRDQRAVPALCVHGGSRMATEG